MSEWKGLWKCPKCEAELKYEPIGHYKDHIRGYGAIPCDGIMVPYDRRASPPPAEPGLRELLKDAMQLLHGVGMWKHQDIEDQWRMSYKEVAERYAALARTPPQKPPCPYYCEPSHVVGEPCTCPCHTPQKPAVIGMTVPGEQGVNSAQTPAEHLPYGNGSDAATKAPTVRGVADGERGIRESNPGRYPMKAADYRAKRHLLAQSYTMQDQLIADLEALESFCEGLKGVNDGLRATPPAPYRMSKLEMAPIDDEPPAEP